jgi:hypothetical protein
MEAKMITRFIARAILSALLGGATLAAAQAQSEETEITAFSVVRGKGTGFKIAEKLGTFVGTLEGPFYVDGGEGPVKAGNLVCSAALEIKTEDRAYKGSGRCLIAGEEGGEVYGQWTCEGHFLVGCSGMFTLTGGTNRFAGITGGGPMTMRSSVGKLGAGTAVSQNVEVEGIVFWRELKYKLP